MPNRRDFLVAAAVVGVEAVTPPQANAQTQRPGEATKVADGDEGFVLSTKADPYELFALWLQEARAARDPAAPSMTLCTVDASGMPDGRMMQHHEVHDGAFLFSSFANSTKGKELSSAPRAALVFYWTTIGRQVRVRGAIRRARATEVEALWRTYRSDRASRLRDLAWPQSRPFDNAGQLEQNLRDLEARYPAEVPRGDWAAYFLTPISIEFFYPHPTTYLHERLFYARAAAHDPWSIKRLVP